MEEGAPNFSFSSLTCAALEVAAAATGAVKDLVAARRHQDRLKGACTARAEVRALALQHGMWQHQ